MMPRPSLGSPRGLYSDRSMPSTGGAQVNAIEKDDQTPLYIAIEQSHRAVVAGLLNESAKATPWYLMGER